MTGDQAIVFNCPHCNQSIRAVAAHAGLRLACPSCRTMVVVPAPPKTAPLAPLTRIASSAPRAVGATGQRPVVVQARSTDPIAVDCKRRVRLPALGLIAIACIGLANNAWGVRSVFTGVVENAKSGMSDVALGVFINLGAFAIYYYLATIPTALVVLAGGLRMLRAKGRPLAIAASVLAVVPCVSPFLWLGIPLGIWSLALLCDAEVKQAFFAERQKRRDSTAGTDAAIVGLAALVVVAVIVGSWPMLVQSETQQARAPNLTEPTSRASWPNPPAQPRPLRSPNPAPPRPEVVRPFNEDGLDIDIDQPIAPRRPFLPPPTNLEPLEPVDRRSARPATRPPASFPPARPEQPPATSLIERLATAPTPDERVQIIHQLTAVAPADRQAAIDAIAVALDDASPSVKYAALESLKSFGFDAKSTVPLLVKRFESESNSVQRQQILQLLGYINDDASEGINLLIEVVRGTTGGKARLISSRYTVSERTMAVRVLGQLGPSAEKAVPALLEVLKLSAMDVEKFTETFQQCADALARIGVSQRGVSAAFKQFRAGKGIRPAKPHLVERIKEISDTTLKTLEETAAAQND